jgi:hypothetical protein
VSPHAVTVRQAPGWWPALVQVICECGGRGPVRNAGDSRQRVLLKLDQREHTGNH